MTTLTKGRVNGAAILLHGGAGDYDQKGEGLKRATDELARIAAELGPKLAGGADPLDIVAAALAAMERAGLYTAGRGSLPQADGQFRLTAAMMDGATQGFSGVINVQHTTEPARFARHLQGARSRVLTVPGTEILARQLGVEPKWPDSERTRLYLKEQAAKPQSPATLLEPEGERRGTDTVGCVVRTANGRLVAGTSTGGLAGAFPGRISDSSTVAGTYASAALAISVTGIGEEIIDDGVAARMETRCRDGMSTSAAAQRALDEATARGRDYGWICCDRLGEWVAAYTSETMSWVVADGKAVVARA
jgi:L-asparaginase